MARLRLTDKEKLDILQMKSKGFSSRSISKSLWGTKSRKSTVNDFLKLREEFVTQGQGTVEGPKVLLFDIETAPVMGYVWSLWKQNVGLNQIVSDWYMLSWSAKWLGSDTVMYQDIRGKGEDDTSILKGLSALLGEADWVITHNGDSFDLPKVRARMLLQGLEPFSPVKSIDTCKAAKKAFKFTSNKLEYLADKLAPEHAKSRHDKFPGFELWTECLADNTEAWDEMQEYNMQDVDSLEAVYLKLRPWMPQHPNFALYTETTEEQCNCCGSTDLKETGKFYYTNLSKFELVKCVGCGTWKRRRYTQLSKEKRNTLLMNS